MPPEFLDLYRADCISTRDDDGKRKSKGKKKEKEEVASGKLTRRRPELRILDLGFSFLSFFSLRSFYACVFFVFFFNMMDCNFIEEIDVH